MSALPLALGKIVVVDVGNGRHRSYGYLKNLLGDFRGFAPVVSNRILAGNFSSVVFLDGQQILRCPRAKTLLAIS